MPFPDPDVDRTVVRTHGSGVWRANLDDRTPRMGAPLQYASPVSADCQLSSQSAESPGVDASHTKARCGSRWGLRAPAPVGLGPALRRAWVGYQRRLDRAMADAGFDERRFPDGRVLRLCSRPAGSTISSIGRELGITRQGAGKVVSHLHDRVTFRSPIRQPADERSP